MPLAVTELGGRSGRPGHCRVRRSRALRGHTRPSPGRPLLPEAVSTHAGTAAASQRFSPGGSDMPPPPPSRCGILCPMLTPPAEDEDSPGTGVPMATLLPPAPAPATMGHSHWLSYSSTERHFYTCGIQLIKKKNPSRKGCLQISTRTGRVNESARGADEGTFPVTVPVSPGRAMPSAQTPTAKGPDLRLPDHSTLRPPSQGTGPVRRARVFGVEDGGTEAPAVENGAESVSTKGDAAT